MQATRPNPARDRRRAQACRSQLFDRHDSVLATRDLGNGRIGCVALRSHTEHKATQPRSLPLWGRL